MKRFLTLPVAALVLLLTTPQVFAADKPTSFEDRVSYSIGANMGRDFMQQGAKLNTDLLVQGIKDATEGNDLLMPPEEIRAAISELQQKFQANAQAALKAMGDKNKAEGEKFLAENAKKDGIKVTDSGLQYQVVKDGDGKQPLSTDTVKVNYSGTLLDGTEFDSSYKRGEPITFKLNGVIPGWTEALQLMKEGAKYKVFIPSALAYGERGMPPRIEPNSTLVFEIELLAVNP